MNYSVEWLFEEVYKLKQEKPEEKIHFISDWDIEREESKEFNNVLAAVYNKAGENSFKYNYSYEQFAIKEQIIGYANKRYSLPILQTELSITPSSTISIFLILSGLKELGIKRILVITPTYFSVHDSLKKNNLNLFNLFLEDSFQNLWPHVSPDCRNVFWLSILRDETVWRLTPFHRRSAPGSVPARKTDRGFHGRGVK